MNYFYKQSHLLISTLMDNYYAHNYYAHNWVIENPKMLIIQKNRRLLIIVGFFEWRLTQLFR